MLLYVLLIWDWILWWVHSIGFNFCSSLRLSYTSSTSTLLLFRSIILPISLAYVKITFVGHIGRYYFPYCIFAIEIWGLFSILSSTLAHLHTHIYSYPHRYLFTFAYSIALCSFFTRISSSASLIVCYCGILYIRLLSSFHIYLLWPVSILYTIIVSDNSYAIWVLYGWDGCEYRMIYVEKVIRSIAVINMSMAMVMLHFDHRLLNIIDRQCLSTRSNRISLLDVTEFSLFHCFRAKFMMHTFLWCCTLTSYRLCFLD
jgi:hypothetical protein